MNRLYFLFSFLLFSSILLGQDEEHPHLLGFSFSETDYEAADFIKISGTEGQVEVVSVVKGMGAFSAGVSVLDEWRGEYIVWGQTVDKEQKGYVFNPLNGQVLRTISATRPPLDLQYDYRLRRVMGLRYAPNREGLEIVKIKNGNVITLCTIKDIKYFSVGNTAFDSNRGLYIFAARNQDNEERLYRVNTNDGSILDQPLIDDYIFDEFQYDLQDNKLYALARKKDNVGQFFFVEVNMLNAYPTIIRPLVGLLSIEVRTSAFNSQLGSYFFIAKEDKGQRYLYQLDVMSGSILSKAAVSEKLSEIQFDNTAFTVKFYKDVQMEEEKEESSYFSEKNGAVQVFEKNVTNNTLDCSVLDFLEDETVQAVIYDVNNRAVLQQTLFLKDVDLLKEINVKNLPKGIYVAKVKTRESVFTQRFVKL